MNQKETLKRLKEKYQKVVAPQEGLELLEKSIKNAKEDKKVVKNKKRAYRMTAVVAAALVIIILPNTNKTLAQTLNNIPVIGKVFKVVTIRKYQYSDEQHELSAEVPQIAEGENSISAKGQMNRESSDYVEALVRDFKRDMKESGYSGLDISYKVVKDDDSWFTLRFDILENQASGYEFHRFYHIDKKTGKTVTLKDLFLENADYVGVISKEIIRQMQKQMDEGKGDYFLVDNGVSDGFRAIGKNENFYFNDKDELVIAFDEYEVGPGYIGAPEFTIPDGVISEIRKY